MFTKPAAEEEEGGRGGVHVQPEDGHDDTDGAEHAPARPPEKDGLRVKPPKDETWCRTL